MVLMIKIPNAAAQSNELIANRLAGGQSLENGLDYGADTLKTLADEQRSLSGRDLVRVILACVGGDRAGKARSKKQPRRRPSKR